MSVTLPEDLLKKFDDFMKARGYFSRSEAFRDALRNLMAEAEFGETKSENISATIMVSCDIERKDVDLRLPVIRHEFDDVVVENMHRHIGDRYCLEIFIAEGNGARILDLVGRIRGMRGIQQVKALFMSL